MSTHPTQDSSRTPDSFFRSFRPWKLLILVALLPLAAACTDTVTGLEQLSEESETRIEDPTEELPVAR